MKRLTVAPQFRSHYAWRGAGAGSYHALQVTIRLRMTHGLQWDFNYTYSSSIDIGSNAERVNEVDAYYQADPIINSWSPAQLRGVSDFDTTHQFNTNWICQLPFGQGHRFAGTSGRLLNVVVGGWQWCGLARWTRGFPTTIETLTSFPTNWYLPSTAILSGPKPQTRTFLNEKWQSRSVQGSSGGMSCAGRATSESTAASAGGGRSRITEPEVQREVFTPTNAVRFDVASLPQNTGQLEQPAAVFGTYNSTVTKPRVMQFVTASSSL